MRKTLHTLLISLSLACSATVFAQGNSLTLDQVIQEERRAVTAGQSVRAQLVSVGKAVLSAGISSQVSKVKYVEGDTVKRNDVIVEFDCAPLEAQKKIYQSEQKVAEINLSVKQRLLELNNVGAQELALSQAELAKAMAQLEVIDVELKQCKIAAPFAGTIVKRAVEPFQFVNKGEPVLELISKDDLEVLLIAPSSWLKWLEPDAGFSMRVEEIGESFPGVVLRLGGRVDPVSQTILVYGKLTESSAKLLPGMSGDLQFELFQ